MKFDCDYFKDRQQAKHEKELEEFRKAQQWHKVYALFPIKIGPNDCRWLEEVEQRIVVFKHWEYDTERAMDNGFYEWQCRAIPAQSA